MFDGGGQVVQKQKLNSDHSTFFSIPEAGTYTLLATLGAPSFERRGGEAECPALADGVTVEFPDIELGPQ